MIWLSIYLLISLHTILHECFHYILAKQLLVMVSEISLGKGPVIFKYRNLRIALVLTGGYITINQEELYSKSILEIILFYESGSIANLLLAILVRGVFQTPLVLVNDVISFVIIASNHIPWGESDMAMLLQTIRHKNTYMMK